MAGIREADQVPVSESAPTYGGSLSSRPSPMSLTASSPSPTGQKNADGRPPATPTASTDTSKAAI